jgi:5'-3' exonuclease
MDRYGKGEELVLDNVFQAVDQKPSFQNFDQELFTAMCVLAGCDFLPSVPGVGISRAHAFISKYQSVELVSIYFDKPLFLPSLKEKPKTFKCWNDTIGFVISQDKKRQTSS